MLVQPAAPNDLPTQSGWSKLSVFVDIQLLAPIPSTIIQHVFSAFISPLASASVPVPLSGAGRLLRRRELCILSLVPAPQDSDAFEGFAMSMPLARIEPVNLVFSRVLDK